MSTRHRETLAGLGLGAVWGVVLVWVGTVWVNFPIFSYTWILALAYLFPGLVLAALIGWRYFDDSDSGRAQTDAAVLRDTGWHLVLALALWPVTGFVLVGEGPGVVLMLGIGFAIARLAFWVGSHRSPPLRAFGFSATFCPTLIALGWAVLWRFVN